jgi:hypothetical protein
VSRFAGEEWLYPKADKSRLTALVICRGAALVSIWHPGSHVGYGLACVRGRKNPPCGSVLLAVTAGSWLARNERWPAPFARHRAPSLVPAGRELAPRNRDE